MAMRSKGLARVAAAALALGVAAASPASPASAAAPAPAETLRVLDVVELPAAWRMKELSGLAWAPEEAALFAVSDRGRLWRLPVQIEPGSDGDRLQLGTPAPVVPLPAAAGGAAPNAEALAWRGPGAGSLRGALIVADESSHEALVVDTLGRALGRLAVPGPADLQARLRGDNNGIEALAWHPVHGLMAATQRPLRDADPRVHRIHAADGRSWALRAASGGRSAVKAIELLGPGTLLVLERVGSGAAGRTVLRALPLDACRDAAPCDPPPMLLDDARVGAENNFEGLACPRSDRCLIVSDDAGAKRGRTLLVLLSLQN